MPTCFNINPFERNIFLEKQHILILINKEYTLKLWTNHNYVSSSMLWRVIEFSILNYQIPIVFTFVWSSYWPNISLLHATLVTISAQDPNSETLFLSSENLNCIGKESFKGELSKREDILLPFLSFFSGKQTTNLLLILLSNLCKLIYFLQNPKLNLHRRSIRTTSLVI